MANERDSIKIERLSGGYVVEFKGRALGGRRNCDRIVAENVVVLSIILGWLGYPAPVINRLCEQAEKEGD